MYPLDNKIALVTGGSGVLGGAIAKGLATAGAHVIILARNQSKINQIVQQIQQAGYNATGISANVLDKGQLTEAAQQLNQEFEKIDILVNGAGGNHPDATAVPGKNTFFDLPPEALQWVFNLNLMGSILTSQVFGEHMARHGSGSIINISSMAAYQPLTRVVAYAAAKAAINNFTQWLAVYMATEHNPAIRVNAIAPGFFLGDQNRYLLLDDDDNLTQRGQQIIDHTPMQRFGNPDDLVGVSNWLASDASQFVTGTVIPVDGGFYAFSGV